MGPEPLGRQEATRTLGTLNTLLDEISSPRRLAIVSGRKSNFAHVAEMRLVPPLSFNSGESVLVKNIVLQCLLPSCQCSG